MWTDNAELYHWGVRGMKWGVRRYQKKNGTLTAEGKKRYANPHADYVRAHEKKKVWELSDAELTARINRLQKEQQYDRLTMTPSTLKKAEKIVTGLITTMGTIATLNSKSEEIVKLGKAFVESPALKKAIASTALSGTMLVNMKKFT